MKRVILGAAAVSMCFAAAMAQTENPRGVYKMSTLVDKTGLEIKAPYDQYKVCTDSITLQVDINGSSFHALKNDAVTFNYTGEEPDSLDSTLTRVFNSNADHFSEKWWSTYSRHMYFPKNDWCTENYVANSYSEKGRVLFDALLNPPAATVDKAAPLYGSWCRMGTFDDLADTKAFAKKMKKDHYVLDYAIVRSCDIVVLTPKNIVKVSGSIEDLCSDGKKYFVESADPSTSQKRMVTWLTPDIIAVSFSRYLSVNNFTDYELWYRIKGGVAPISRIAHENMK